jgi:hypothetical protein
MTPLRLTAVPLFLLCTGARLCAQVPELKCDWSRFQQNAADLRAARDAARKVPESEGNTDVPPEAIKQIQQFKNSLYAALEDYFRCQPPRVPDAQAVQSDLYTRFSLPVPPPPKDAPEDTDSFTGLYLAGITFTVQTVPDARNLVAVLTEFGIPYGGDAELDIFSLQGGAWKPVVNFTSQPYKSIYGAFEAFDYKISPPDAKNNWFVVTTHINPWPSSCWQTLFVDALRPDQIGMIGSLLHDEQWGYVCDDVPPYLRSVTADTFQVRFSVTSMDESVLWSGRVMTYKVRGDEVVRIQPFAANPVNFVDEWLRSDWLHAREWSATRHLDDLRRAHQKEHKREGQGDFAAFRSCSSASLKEIEFDEVEQNGRNRFFLVRQNGNVFQMIRMSDRHDPSCKGPDRLATIKDR